MVSRGHVDGVVVHHDDARLAPQAHQCAPDGMVAAPDGHEVDVVTRRRGRGLADLDAPLFGQARSVHVAHRLLAHLAEDALEHGQGEDAGVGVGQLALEADLEHVRHPSGQRRIQLAEPLSQGEEGAHGGRRLGRAHVHGEGHELAGQGQANLLGDGVARLVLGLGRAGAEVGSDDDLRQLEQRRARGRLRGEDIDGGPADPAVPDGVSEGVFVDHPATGDVHDPQVRLGLGEQLFADHAKGLGGLDDVEGEEVRHPHQLEQLEQLDVDLASPLRSDERIVGDDLHPERRRPLGHQLADASEADDPERLVGQLHALPLGPLPAPGDEGSMGLRNVAGLGQQHGHRVLRGGEDVRLRGVHHHHALLGSGLGVDVVEPDAGSSHHDEVRTGGQHLCGDRRRRADDQGVGTRHRRQEPFRREVQLEVDLVAGRPESVEAPVGDLLGHQDASHGRSLVGPPQRPPT